MNEESSFEAAYSKIIGYYRENAEERFEYFERTKSNHCDYFLNFITPPPGKILDVGSGSGRDSAFFANKGYDVIAVEPAHELRELAAKKHSFPNIEWFDDRLPELEKFKNEGIFDNILLSTVIFHLPETETRKIIERLHVLLKKDGMVFIGLRNGPSDTRRPMFNITKEWIISQSQDLFTVVAIEESEDDYKRENVSWSRMVLKKV